HMASPQCRQAKTLVIPGVCRVPDADQAVVEEPDRGGDDTFVAKTPTPQVAFYLGSECWQGLAKFDQRFKFGRTALRRPGIMIAVLLATPLVAACGLDMPAGIFANPHVAPCRWYHQRLNACHFKHVRLVARGISIDKAPSALPAMPAGVLIRRKCEGKRGAHFVGTHAVQNLFSQSHRSPPGRQDNAGRGMGFQRIGTPRVMPR